MRREEPAATGSTPYPNSTKPSVRLRPVEAGELHPFNRCAWCGSTCEPLRRQPVVWTHAEAVFCAEVVTCCRRREVSRRAA